MNTSSQLPPADLIPRLEGYLKNLQSLAQAISTVRYQTFPSLINNLQQPIQACDPNNPSSSPDHLNEVKENWKCDSQDLLQGLKALRLQAMNSQEAMKYVRATTQTNMHLTIEEKEKAFEETRLLNQKTKEDGLQRFKSRSSLSRRAKATSPIIEQHIIETELLKRKKLRLLKQRCSFPEIFVPVIDLKDCIQRINASDRQSGHLTFVSENQILLKDVMKIFVVFKRTTQSHKLGPSLVIERAFCFGLTESPTNTFQRSSFGLIRSINRCINHYINRFFNTNHDQNASNLWLICSLLSSYKDFFKAEISPPSGKEATAVTTNNLRLTHLQPTQQLQQQHQQQHQLTGLSSHPSKYDTISRDSNQSFLTWRRWKLDPACLDKLLTDRSPHDQPKNAEQQIGPVPDQSQLDRDALHDVLSGGHWAKIPEIN
ncbi:hypothetical protein PTTG_09570 [Puccinia triticina 1-1 BBBD Race 1]|uniref:Uncharacterized protein n=3 Tax=Puccinia triticina TaxID=208348 RepID=A0A180GJ56_PUCT1|nr:uncharacterized protein PtA15_18A27 [Puccinia triticina]OAV92469.1 hypothetical protein PTTG_09570 [Puccinia triticina 1-1 BBBD Race 1]WAQ92972.1 hypothetical protein PtA15_18A27 [Puccinia triticina]